MAAPSAEPAGAAATDPDSQSKQVAKLEIVEKLRATHTIRGA